MKISLAVCMLFVFSCFTTSLVAKKYKCDVNIVYDAKRTHLKKYKTKKFPLTDVFDEPSFLLKFTLHKASEQFHFSFQLFNKDTLEPLAAPQSEVIPLESVVNYTLNGIEKDPVVLQVRVYES